jgi:hypothetical protein
MSRDTTVIPFRQPEAIDDPLSELAREGARRMLAQVLMRLVTRTLDRSTGYTERCGFDITSGIVASIASLAVPNTSSRRETATVR